MRAVRYVFAALAAAALVGCAAGSDRAGFSDERLAYVAPDDPDMEAAIANARDTLEVFFTAHDRNDGQNSNFFVKVGLPTRHDNIEYIWAEIVEVDDQGFTGVLLNEPVDLAKGLKEGSQVTFGLAEIADWSFDRGGKSYGNFTTRVLLRNHPPPSAAEAKEAMESLWPTPLPPETI